MKSDFLARRALVILCIVFFLLPFALRGMPAGGYRDSRATRPPGCLRSLPESQDLAWLKQHFRGEPSFAILTWNGCSDQDESYRLFVEKLKSEVLPEGEALIGDEDFSSASECGHTAEERVREPRSALRQLTRGRQWGDQLGLFCAGSGYDDWGGQKEKWFRGTGESWYYITPDGDLFRWDGSTHLLGVLGRSFRRTVLGQRASDGTLMASFGQRPTGTNRNSFHDDPQRLTARVLSNVMSGPEMLRLLLCRQVPCGRSMPTRMTQSGGADATGDREPLARHVLWSRTVLAVRVVGGRTAARRQCVTVQKQLPADWLPRADTFLSELIQKEYDGERSELLAAEPLVKRRHWEALFASLGVPSPALQTGIIVSLSPVGLASQWQVLGEASGGCAGQTDRHGTGVGTSRRGCPRYLACVSLGNRNGSHAEDERASGRNGRLRRRGLGVACSVGLCHDRRGSVDQLFALLPAVVSVVIVASGLLCRCSPSPV